MVVVTFGTEFFSVRGNRKVQEKKMEVIKNQGRSHENVKRRLEAAESKRSTDEDFEVPESTLRKWMKTVTVPTSLDRFKATFPNEDEKQSADFCRDPDARFCGLEE